MKINLKQLKLNQEDAVYLNYEGSIDDRFLTASGASLKSPAGIELVIKRQNQVYYGQGTIKTAIEFSCSRCLKLFTEPIFLELAFIIAEAGNEGGYDEEVILLENDEADITHYIEGVIFAEVPLNPICDPNCKGLCPFCGGDKNIEECNCDKQEIDPRWEKLKKFNSEGG
ncbi:MAG TPA: DUF177 domain-containing protein [Syntrophomonadaceae bacterium]|nr:DUF177 domain-containing protein [Syntrophomonadaceae bacterium]HNX27788.1 DUF177 domain-containing protein [Syntrophomonadaceae bacterium]HPR93580.1 DUF177 domain-containing protein [Syntrophomonadaceae bacterium]